MRVRWQREGSGWVGRWETDDSHGEMGQLVVASTGGLHGGWRWRIECWAQGLRHHACARDAKREAEKVARALFKGRV